jgi:hypothetical protein
MASVVCPYVLLCRSVATPAIDITGIRRNTGSELSARACSGVSATRRTRYQLVTRPGLPVWYNRLATASRGMSHNLFGLSRNFPFRPSVKLRSEKCYNDVWAW